MLSSLFPTPPRPFPAPVRIWHPRPLPPDLGQAAAARAPALQCPILFALSRSPPGSIPALLSELYLAYLFPICLARTYHPPAIHAQSSDPLHILSHSTAPLSSSRSTTPTSTAILSALFQYTHSSAVRHSSHFLPSVPFPTKFFYSLQFILFSRHSRLMTARTLPRSLCIPDAHTSTSPHNHQSGN